MLVPYPFLSLSLFAHKLTLVKVEKRKQEKKLKKMAVFCEEIIEEPKDGNGVIRIEEKKQETKQQCHIIKQKQTKIQKAMSYS